MEYVYIAGCLVALTAAAWWHRSRPFRSSLPLPPGPRGLPILGNTLQIPREHAWRQYLAWVQQYGPLVSINVAGKTIILLGNARVVRDLLDKRAVTSSDRPPMIMANDLIFRGMHMLIRPYDAMYRLHQKMHAPVLSPHAATSYAEMYEMETKLLLHEILTCDQDSDVTHFFDRSNLGVMYGLVYGIEIETGQEQFLRDTRSFQKTFSQVTMPGAYLVDTFPFLNWLPARFAPWKREAIKMYKVETAHHLRLLEKGLLTPGWTFAKQFAESAEGKKMSRVELAYSLGVLVHAGFDTTTMVVEWFLVACLTHPHFVARAQEQLDRVIGRGRLPVLADQDNLPYIRAIIEETIRWRHILASGVPHYQTQDDEYQGYRIPKGAILLPQHYAIGNNPADYEHPDRFAPERWLGPEGLAFMVSGFGFGRRICTGRHIARHNLFLVIARLLWGFDIKHAVDEYGKEISVSADDMVSGLNTNPLPFRARFNVRGPWAAEVIRGEWENTDRDIGVVLEKIGKSRKK